MPSEDVQEADLEAAEDPDLDATEESPPQHELSEAELEGDDTTGALYVHTIRSLLVVLPVASPMPDAGCAILLLLPPLSCRVSSSVLREDVTSSSMSISTALMEESFWNWRWSSDLDVLTKPPTVW
jgi:hypothetical protein